MASPTVSTAQNVVDPLKNGRYTVQISDALGSSSSTATWSSVKYNHKPAQSTETRTTLIKAGDDGSYTLHITDQTSSAAEPQRYAYDGTRKHRKKDYVLVFSQDRQTCTLEPVGETYSFNLTSTPWETSKSKLQAQYRQLKETKSDEEGPRQAAAPTVPSDGSDLEPDPTKPYDFRRFLHLVPTSSSPPNEAGTGSAAGTPRSDYGRSTPQIQTEIRAAPTKPARVAKSQPSQTRKRKTPEPSNTASKSSKTSAVPTVRLDRRASTRTSDAKPASRASASTKQKPKPQAKSSPIVHSSDDEDEPDGGSRFEPDDGGLQIDFGDAAPRKRHFSTSIPLASATNGPISLRSAANSAANTPLVNSNTGGRMRNHSDVIEFDLGGDNSDSDDGYREDDEGERDADGDEDIEPMDLGPPAHEARTLSPELRRVEGRDEEDEEFVAEMMQELLSQEEEETSQVAAAESDEESEEE